MLKNFYRGALLLFWLIFTFLDFQGPQFSGFTDPLKYGSLWLCIFWVICQRTKAVKKDWCLLLSGLLITAICDYFLLFTNEYRDPIMLFALVHVCYLQRMMPNLKNWPLLLYILTSVSVHFFSSPADSLDLEGIFYAGWLLADLLGTFLTRHPQRCRLRVALLCFALCDLFVALTNLTASSIDRWLIPLMWLFYLPAQYFLSQSTIPLKPKNVRGTK